MTQDGNPNSDGRIYVRVPPSVKPVVPEFLKNAREDVGALRAFLDRQDYQSITRLGHSMKGSTSFGFDYLNQIGLSLERTAAREEYRQIELLVNDLEDYLDRVEPVYDAA